MDRPEDNLLEEKIFLHVHNKGVENRVIFNHANDYTVFLDFIREYVSPVKDRRDLRKDFQINGRTYQGMPHLPKNYHGKIEIVAYSLTSGTFHLVVREIIPNTLENFMRSLCTRYVIYYNKKHNHVGRLFQGPYEAVYINGADELSTITDNLYATGTVTSQNGNAQFEKIDLASTPQGSHNRRSNNHVFAFASIALMTFIALTSWSIRNIHTTQTLGVQTTVHPTVRPTEYIVPTTVVEQPALAMVQVHLSDPNLRANIRAYPNSTAPIIGKVMNGDTFAYVSQENEWYGVIQPDGSLGYIAASSLKVLESQTHD